MICDNCGDRFPSTLRIEGKVRNLSSRLYCLGCSPFRSHNTRNLKKSVPDKPYSHTKEYFRNKRERLKKKAIEYKGNSCTVCGYNKCLSALEFHHVNPKEKSFPLTVMQSMAWKRIQEELDKCILVCANCHREIEEEIRKLPS